MGYWANAVALNEIGKPERLFTYSSVTTLADCDKIFESWANVHGYKLLISWVDKEDSDGTMTLMHKTEYRQNFT